jgi:hypothetical protein
MKLWKEREYEKIHYFSAGKHKVFGEELAYLSKF